MPRIHLRPLRDAVDVPAPPSPGRLDQLLPALRILDDRVTASALHSATVTCAEGCSACCEIQPVPVSPAEAFAILRLVEQLPEPRRTQVMAAFADREQRLHQAGLAAGFLQGRRPHDDTSAQAEARVYLSLALSCPFLEDQRCSIYSERPFACREYYVSSPSALCSHPIDEPVAVVPNTGPGLAANLAATAPLLGRAAFSVPLTLALSYAELHRALLESTYPGLQLFTSFVAAFSSQIPSKS